MRVALGTGSYMMAYVMFFVALTFINREGMDDIITLYHVLLTAPFGVLVRLARGTARIGGCGIADSTTRLYPWMPHSGRAAGFALRAAGERDSTHGDHHACLLPAVYAGPSVLARHSGPVIHIACFRSPFFFLRRRPHRGHAF